MDGRNLGVWRVFLPSNPFFNLQSFRGGDWRAMHEAILHVDVDEGCALRGRREVQHGLSPSYAGFYIALPWSPRTGAVSG